MVHLSEQQFIVEFDSAAEPVVEIDPGDEIEADVLDWCFREVTDRPETYARCAQMPRCPCAGPVAVRGARLGDALQVEVLVIQCKSPGHMVIRPGVGPLAARVEHIEVVRVPLECGAAVLPSGIRVPQHPMLGVIGTAPASGSVPTLWSGDHGGNMDTREVCVGSVVHLPVFVPGGLLAFGDVHSAMGDGELAGSGVEVNAVVRVRVRLTQAAHLTRPRVETSDAMITLATHEETSEAVRLVTEDMISWLQDKADMSFRDALLLVGAVASLRFSHVINKPGPTVKLVLNRSLLEG